MRFLRRTLLALAALLAPAVLVPDRRGLVLVPALAAVGPELTAVSDVFGGSTLVDDEFLVGNVEQNLNEQQFGIVHVATHGQFRSNASDSFLLTYDGRLGIDPALAGGVVLTTITDVVGLAAFFGFGTWILL